MMKIAIGADHRGAKQKRIIQEKIRQLEGLSIEWIDVGCSEKEVSCEYPLYARRVCRSIQTKTASAGILLCGSGIGMAIAANRFESIYAALAWNAEVARLSKEHDNANVLVLASDFLDDTEVVELVIAWLSSEFNQGRYQKRLDIIDGWGGLSN